MSRNKKSSQFYRVHKTDSTSLIPLIQGNPLFNAIITPEDLANGLFPFLGIDNKVDKLSGHSLVPDEEIVKLKALDSSGELDLSSVELLENKQNSLEPDETELKYPTVRAVIEGLETKVNIEEGKSLVDDLEIERLSTVTNQNVDNLVEKIEGYSLVKDTEIAKLEALTEEIDFSHLELTENKQDSLLADNTGVKFPTVDAVNEGLDTKVDKEYGKSLVDDEEILRLSSVVNQDISNLVEKEAGKSLILDTEIARLATLENVSIEHLATKEELETKVDKEEGKSLVSDEEILRLSTVTNQNIEHLATKDELSNKVDKEVGKVLIEQTELTRLSTVTNQDISHLASKDELDNLVVKEAGKSLIADEEIVRLSTVTNQDISNLATKGELDNLVVKEVGKSLVDDEEIARLALVSNQSLDGLATKEELESKVDKESGKSLMDDAEIARLALVDNQDISHLATKEELADKVTQEAGKSLILNTEIERLSTVTNQDISVKVDKVEGKSLIDNVEIERLKSVTNQTLEGLEGENKGNKQNTLDVDSTNKKYPTVTAVLKGLSSKEDISSVDEKLGLKVDKVTGKSLVSDDEIARLSTVTNQSIEHLASKEEVSKKVDKEVGKVLIDKTEADRLLSVTNQDVSNFVEKQEGKALIDEAEILRLKDVTNQDISNKVDKVPGKSLILDTEIERLKSITNQTLEGLGAEDVHNKKSIINEESDTEYPTSKAVADYVTDSLNSLELTGYNFTGSEVDLSNPLGAYQVAIANTSTAYTLSANKVIGGWSKIKINASTEPTVTGGIKIKGSDFTASTDMYLLAEYNGTTTEYYFAEI